jgi:hypothetical protein
MLEVFLDYFGSQELMDGEAVAKMLMRLAIDVLATTLVVRAIYVRLYQWNEQVFTYFAFNVVTFSLCLLLRKVPIELGFALGLFAVFGILRYRTEPIRIRDLTYLFVVIGIAILNAVANKNVSVAELVLINGVIVFMVWVLEWRGTTARLESAVITYDNPTLLLPGRETELAADLVARTGLSIEGFEVERVDLVSDTARIRVSYRSHRGGTFT